MFNQDDLKFHTDRFHKNIRTKATELEPIQNTALHVLEQIMKQLIQKNKNNEINGNKTTKMRCLQICNTTQQKLKEEIEKRILLYTADYD